MICTKHKRGKYVDQLYHQLARLVAHRSRNHRRYPLYPDRAYQYRNVAVGSDVMRMFLVKTTGKGVLPAGKTVGEVYAKDKRDAEERIAQQVGASNAASFDNTQKPE
jgi:hypothetical protein